MKIHVFVENSLEWNMNMDIVSGVFTETIFLLVYILEYSLESCQSLSCQRDGHIWKGKAIK
jgi:hypothetical protein